MEQHMEEEIAQLNKILALCRNAEQGYQVAARQAMDTQLEEALKAYALQRNEMAYELAQQIRILGGEPAPQQGLKAAAHRIWINIKGMISGENTRTIIEECLRGERASVEYYNAILNETTFPSGTRLMLNHQLDQIKDAIRSLDDWK